MSSSSSTSSSWWRQSRRNSANATLSARHVSSGSMGRLDLHIPQSDMHRGWSASQSEHSSIRGMRRLEARRQMEMNSLMSSRARTQSLNPPVDLRLLEYVEHYDENLMCPICRCPFVDPVVLTECDHCFCRDCIRQTWTSTYTPLGSRGDCPSCRTPAKLGPRSAVSKILTNILDDLLVRCPNGEDGCKAAVKRGEVQDHINIYCGFANVDCPAENCELPVRRKDSVHGCLHYGVSCMDCHQSMQKASLETHWKSECPDRKVSCDLCQESVFYRELEIHIKETCPAISIPCVGQSVGCTVRNNRAQIDEHARNCMLAMLAPVLEAQAQRLNEQETAQKLMSRKLEALETGFITMQQILYPQSDGPDLSSANESRIPLLGRYRRVVSTDTNASVIRTDPSTIEFSVPSRSQLPNFIEMEAATSQSIVQTPLHPSHPVPESPGPRPSDLPEPYSADFDMASPFPPPTANGPYVSPLHHLLSMHESLREEMSRVSSALQELDGRHSMQILNENLRTREEISYLGAQVAGLSRQVHWLTSAQLQRQSRTPTPGGTGSVVAGPSDIAGAGAGVEAAVNAASTAASVLRGATRMASGSIQGIGMRRGRSEEGRTKL